MVQNLKVVASFAAFTVLIWCQACAANPFKGRFKTHSQNETAEADAVAQEERAGPGARHEISDMGVAKRPIQQAQLDEHVYRLTADELLLSINHAFQLEGNEAIVQKPWSDPEVGGFKNRRTYLHFGRGEAEALLDFAATASQSVYETYNLRFQKLETPQTPFDRARTAKCFDDFNCFARELARAFEILMSRPLTETESAELEKAFVQVRTSSSPAEAFRFLVVTLIVDPELIYMQEGHTKKSDARLENRTLAKRISFALTGLPPDASLRKLAEKKDQVTTQEWQTEIDRIVKTEQAAEQFTQFVRDWLDLRPMASLRPQPQLRPELANALDADFNFTVKEAFRNGSFAELLSGEQAWLSPISAEHYGIAWPAAPMHENAGRRRLNLGSARRGIISLAPFLASHADTHDSHPVRRGRMIRERILCKAIEPPNENIPLENPTGSTDETLRERFVRHSKEEACASCHKFMDSLGFSLERFDQAGILRQQQKGMNIDTSGKLEFTKTSDTDFESWADLSRTLALGADSKRCFLQNYISYLADEDLSDNRTPGAEKSIAPLIDTLQSLLNSKSGSLQEITTQIAASQVLLARKSKEEKP